MRLSISDNGKFGRGRSWLVTCYMDGKRIRRSFETRAEAEQYAAETRAAMKTGNSPEQLENARRLCAGTGYAIDDLVKIAVATINNSGASRISPNATFADGVRLYLSMQAEAGARNSTRRHTISALNRLMPVWGDRTMTSITAVEVESYLAQIKNHRGEAGKASTCTKLRTLQYIKAVLRVLGVAQPLASIRTPRPTNHERSGTFFTGDQFIAIMSAARPHERGMLAMALIGGMRPFVLERLSVDCVDMDRRCILIPSSFALDRRTCILETEHIHPENGSATPGLPAVIWDWLKVFPFEPRLWGPMQKRLAGKLGFWIQNGCRNTAATYYNRVHGMAATAALFSSERGYRDVMHHYVASVSRADAERFYSIKPTDFLGKLSPSENE